MTLYSSVLGTDDVTIFMCVCVLLAYLGTGGSHLSCTAVKLDSHLAWIFLPIFFPFSYVI